MFGFAQKKQYYRCHQVVDLLFGNTNKSETLSKSRFITIFFHKFLYFFYRFYMFPILFPLPRRCPRCLQPSIVTGCSCAEDRATLGVATAAWKAVSKAPRDSSSPGN